MPSATFNVRPDELERFNRDLRTYVATFEKDLEKEIENQGRLFLRDAINITPPMQANHGNTFQTVAPMTQRRQGEQAITRDLNRLYHALNSLELIANPHSKKLAKQIRKLIRNREYEALSELLKEFRIDNMGVIPDANAAHHRAHRLPSNGKVRKSIKVPYLVISAPTIQSRKKQAKEMVGFAKSGWMAAARGLQLKGVPNWVARHRGPGIFQRDGRNHQYSVLLGNSVRYIQHLADRIRSRALRRRSDQMQRQMDYWLNKRTGEVNSKR
jgi:hypothetical protein